MTPTFDNDAMPAYFHDKRGFIKYDFDVEMASIHHCQSRRNDQRNDIINMPIILLLMGVKFPRVFITEV